MILNNFSINLIFTRSLSRGYPKILNKAVVNYNNAELQKSLIFKENINKSFVYRWINKINGKDYLGSTTNAKSRLSTYYDHKSLKLANMPIYNALLKYGHSNFIFEIIEYCEPNNALQREQHYLDNFDFDYNILEKANSLLGYKHTIETLAKMKGRKNALGYKHTLETLAKLRDSQTNKKHSEESLKKMREHWQKRKIKSAFSSLNVGPSGPFLDTKVKIRGKLVVVTNIESKLLTEYISISEAALALNITRSTLRKYIKNNRILNLFKWEGNNLLKEKCLITFKDK
uniref:GIY-YIG domain-containing protein n=1 Tax=Heterobasidion irregulare TaxID=984962 RepID=A0A075DDG1_9AGAM|nr:hypothetical protein [Heterobasidion irregulare]